MSIESSTVKERGLRTTPLRDLKLTIAGTPLEGVVREFLAELEQHGIRRVRPHIYLSTEWGVPFGTISLALPFYLARVDLSQLQAEEVGLVEGANRTDILRYLRHEMGHVINYAYRLYDDPEWVRVFGAMTQPYEDEYRPRLFSRDFVRHLPGWYAQKHPDEDWAETFAVWLTPGCDWRRLYADWPTALGKLEYCNRLLNELADRDPLVTDTEADEDIGEVDLSLDEYYRTSAGDKSDPPPGLDGALQTIFEVHGDSEPANPAATKPAAELIRRLEQDLVTNVYRWTGHAPERTHRLLRQMAERARVLHLLYLDDREQQAATGMAALVTALAMNHVQTGSYSA